MNKETTDLYNELKIKDFKYGLKAIELAYAAHAGQKRKFTGEDYINHPVRVAWRAISFPTVSIVDLNDINTKDENVSIALCHDVFEDTETKIEDVKDLFPIYVINGFIALTKKEGENYFDFIMRIKNTPYYRIKIWDLEDNMIDLKEGTLKDKYRLARHVLKQHLS